MLALMPKAHTAASQNAFSVTGVFRGMLDGVLAAVALPGMFVLTLTFAAAVFRAQDVRRRDTVRRFSRQQRRGGMARAGGQCEQPAFE